MSSFTVKHWRSVKMFKFNCNHDLQVFSWWMEQNWEVLVIFKFWPKSHTRTLAEIFKLINYQLCLHSLSNSLSQSKQSNSIETWFTSVFLMKGTELRSFSHFQIFTKITYPDFSRNLENWPILKFLFFHCKTVKISQNEQI